MSIRGLIYGAVKYARSWSGIGRARNYRQMEVAVVLMLPDDVQHQVARWQLELLQKHGLCPGIDVPAHITLKLGFKCRDIEAVAAEVARLASQTMPVPLHLKDFNHFDEGIIFLDVEENPVLESLRQNLLQRLSERHGIAPRGLETSGFHSHVTVTYGLPAQIFRTELAHFESLRQEFLCTADRLAMLVSVDDHWMTYLTCPLGDTRDMPPQVSPAVEQDD